MSAMLPLRYSMGIPDLDKQHQELQESIHLIEDMFSSGETDKIPAAIRQINIFLAAHFVDEERVMNEVQYPDSYTHVQDHSCILLMLGEILLLPPEENSALILYGLRMILRSHILRYDVPMSYFVHNKESFNKTRFKSRTLKALA